MFKGPEAARAAKGSMISVFEKLKIDQSAWSELE